MIPLTGWRAKAACLTSDPDLHYPEKGGSTVEAKRICAVCPVTAECLDYALENEERHGVWGGKSERERRAMTKVAPDLVPADETHRLVAELHAAGLSEWDIANALGQRKPKLGRERVQRKTAEAVARLHAEHVGQSEEDAA